MKSEKRHIANWGNYPKLESQVFYPDNKKELHNVMPDVPQLIPRGNGRCYGDAALSQNILEMLALHNILNFNKQDAIIRCQSGVLLSKILELCVPAGFFLFVSPGTRFITVGGAIAADIHGKNHHKEGSFSDYLISFILLTADGTQMACSKEENPEWFWATCGGMGLTGVILEATFRLRPVSTAFIRQTSYKTRSLNETLERIDASGQSTYSVAWIDCLASGEKLGRGLLLNGEHAKAEDLPEKWLKDPLHFRENKPTTVPFNFPSFALNNLSIKTFNLLYYHRQRSANKESVIHYEPYFYPLDSLLHWNRIYGKNGFTQYQCVLPKAEGKIGIRQLLEIIRDSGFGSFLTVLKLMGSGHPESPLSFPLEGYTLALDFKIQKGLFDMLNLLDQVVLAHSGRLYLAKDARMNPSVFKASYPEAENFAKKFIGKERKFYSALAERLF